MLYVKISYHERGKSGMQFYTSKPFDTIEDGIAYCDRVMQRARLNPNIDETTILPDLIHQVDGTHSFVLYCGNEKRSKFLQSIPTTGYTNMTSF